jgi:hypothetical protein
VNQYWPSQAGFDLEGWRVANPGLTFKYDARPVRADASWLERDIIQKLVMTDTQQSDWPVDYLVPPEMRFDGPIEGYWSPLALEARFDTDMSPFSLQDDQLARRQFRMNLAFDCFREHFWPSEIRGRVFEKGQQMREEDLVRTLERIRLSDEYRIFVNVEYRIIGGGGR